MRLLLWSLFSAQILMGIDIPHFYYTRFLPAETRIAQPYLRSYDGFIAAGSSHNFKLQKYIYNTTHNFDYGLFARLLLPIAHISHKFSHAHQTTLGDVVTSLGYALNYEDSDYFDYIDLTLTVGILFPTTPVVTRFSPIAFPLGTNGHFGFPLSATTSCCLYDWLAFGAHFFAVPLLNQKTILTAHAYLKTDHIVRGFSFLFGYSYDYQGSQGCIPSQSWHRNTFHYQFEYDWTDENQTYGPRLAVFYNQNISGKNIIPLSMGGISLGFDF